MSDIEYKVRPDIKSDDLDRLFSAVWNDPGCADLSSVISHSLTYICAYQENKLVGYVNVAWDGGEHAFLLDTVVDRKLRHQGIGTGLVERAIAETRAQGMKWLHVDYEPHLKDFYQNAGFRPTLAGLVRLRD